MKSIIKLNHAQSVEENIMTKNLMIKVLNNMWLNVRQEYKNGIEEEALELNFTKIWLIKNIRLNQCCLEEELLDTNWWSSAKKWIKL